MRVIVTTPPVASPVTLAQAKAQCRATGFTDDDDLIQGLIDTATAWLDGPAGWLGRALTEQQLQASLDAFPPYFGDLQHVLERPWSAMQLRLPYPPAQAIVAITYVDTTGVVQTLDPASYALNSGVLEPAYGLAWPATRWTRDGVKIAYTAGYSTCPPPICHAILLMVSHLYNHPDAVVGVEARDSSTEMPLGVTSLLTPFRVWEP